MNVRTALQRAAAELQQAGVSSHGLAAELLLQHVLGQDRAWIYAHPEEEMEPEAAEHYQKLVSRRAAGTPTQYLTGKQEFWGLEFHVGPGVLIPRPETEHVMEVALERLGPRGIKINLATGAPSSPLRIADVGTGSGCLAVALAWQLPHAEIFATDISAAALEVARRNATRHAVADRIHFLECDLLDGFATGESPRVGARHAVPLRRNHQALLDLIVSNPPYVARNQAHDLAREIREHEPASALFGGPTGVEIYERLIKQAGGLLRAGGILVLELGYNSAAHVRALLDAQLDWGIIRITNDLAGIPRVIAAERL